MTRRPGVACALGLLAAAACSQPASAAEIPASCTGSTGDTASLSAAITTANANGAGEDTVVLGSGCTYTVVAPDNHWYGPNGLPPIASDIIIEGNGATIARVDAMDAPGFRLFFVGANPVVPNPNYVTPGAGRLTLREVTLTNGLARGGASRAGGGGAGMGGAIFSQGTVVVERSTLTGNSAVGGASLPTLATLGGGGGGMGTNAPPGGFGGGFGPPPPGGFGGAAGGAGGDGAGGAGGAGFRTTETGNPTSAAGPGAGGGIQTGLGGAGGSAAFAGAPGGNGAGGGGSRHATGDDGDPGGAFGSGGNGGGGAPGRGAGGGGVGGGGGSVGSGLGAGGGGGFGGGGGEGGSQGTGGSGGFGGGGGGGNAVLAAPGFGGGAPTADAAGGGAGMGGAIFNMQGSLTIRNSTLAANAAVGGEDVVPDGAKGMGGAVFNLSGAFTAEGSTLASNSADFDGTSIYNLVYDGHTARTAQTTLRNTIVGRGTGPFDLTSNKSAFITPPNVGTANADLTGRNLVRTRRTVDGGTITGAPLTADPLLGPLAANGGPTRTMAPSSGSPVIDAGSAFGLATDQRGLPRPSNFLAIPDAADGSDIGAVELQAPPRATPGPGTAGPPRAPAFGAATRVVLRLVPARIPARGPIRVRVSNRNGFRIIGRLGARTVRRVEVSRRRVVRLRSRAFSVRAGSRTTVRLRLPRALRRVLRERGRLSLRLTATVKDPAGNTRSVRKRVAPKLRRRR